LLTDAHYLGLEAAAQAAANLTPERLEDQQVAERVRLLRIDQRARQLLAADGWRYPPPEVSSSLLNDLAREREMVRYRIESLIGIRHNASLTGMYKTGKTGLACDLATALADGRPFLGSLAVEMPQGRIGFWNGEMDRDDFLDYTRPFGIQNPNKIETLHLRGYRVPLITDAGAAWTAWWLRYNGSRSGSTTRGLGSVPGRE